MHIYMLFAINIITEIFRRQQVALADVGKQDYDVLFSSTINRHSFHLTSI